MKHSPKVTQGIENRKIAVFFLHQTLGLTDPCRSPQEGTDKRGSGRDGLNLLGLT